MKRALAVLLVVLLVASGCSKTTQGQKENAEDIKIATEKIVKEFTGTINIFNRIDDTLMLTAESGDSFENYNVNLATGEVTAGETNEGSDQYVYFEQVADKGYLYVEGEGTDNVLKYKDKKGNDKIVTNNVGFADGINISISSKGNLVAYTALKQGTEDYGLFMQDLETSKNYILIDKVDENFIASFDYMVNWSDDDKYVIIQDKYIYDTSTGSRKGELASTYTQWSPSGSKIAFILEDDSSKWLNASGSLVYPGKKVCIYDMKTGDYKELFNITEDENVFGELTWNQDETRLAFVGIKIKDKASPEWYTKLIYNSIYVVDVESGKFSRLETKLDVSDGSLIELGNLVFAGSGNLLSYTIGNFEKSNLNVFDIKASTAKTLGDVEYLHWLGNQGYVVPAGKTGLYFCRNNSIIRLDENLQETVKYTSKSSLDDFYLSGDGKSMIVLETEGNGSIIRYIGK